MNDWKMRTMRPQDLPAVYRAADSQHERDGTSYPVPQIFVRDAEGVRLAPNVAMALVTEKDGRCEQAHVFIRTIEMMSFGTNPRATLASMEQMPAVYYALAGMGFEDLHVLVPKGPAAVLESTFLDRMRLRRDDDRLAHFYARLRAE